MKAQKPSPNCSNSKGRSPKTYRLEFFLHAASDVNRLLGDGLDGQHSASVDTYLGVHGGVTEVSVGVGAQGHLTGSDQRVGGLHQCENVHLTV